MPEAPSQVSKSVNQLSEAYVLIFLEERIICVTAIILSVKLHIIQAVGVLARIRKELAHHGIADFVSKEVLLLVEELHLLLFSNLLQLGPSIKVEVKKNSLHFSLVR